MKTPLNRLLHRLDADTKKLGAEGETRKTSSRMEQALRRAGRGVERFEEKLANVRSGKEEFRNAAGSLRFRESLIKKLDLMTDLRLTEQVERLAFFISRGETTDIRVIKSQIDKARHFSPGRRKGAIAPLTKLMQGAADSLPRSAKRQDVIDRMIEMARKSPQGIWQEFEKEADGVYLYSPSPRQPHQKVTLQRLLNSISDYRRKAPSSE